MAGRSRFHRHATTTPAQSTNKDGGIDLSLLQKPMELSITGAIQIARCLSGGTMEMRELLTEECDIIFECRVCRNLFRNLPNFIAHKRHYCQECYSDTKVKFVEPKPEHETLLIQPKAPKEKVVAKNKVNETDVSEANGHEKKDAKAKDTPEEKTSDKIKNNKDKASDASPKESVREIVTEGNSDAYKFYTNLKERADVRVESMKRCLVELEDVQGNKNAKRQRVVSNAEEKDIRAAAKKHNPSLADIAIITQSFEQEEANPVKGGETAGSRRISLRQRGGGGEVKTPFAEKLAKRKDCDVKTQTCLKCKAKYSSLKTLHFHMMSLHSERKTFYPCVYAKCKSTFSQITVAVRHLQRAHNCPKTKMDQLKEHLKKFAFTRPVDEASDYDGQKDEEEDGVVLKAKRQKQAEVNREKTEKVKKDATETVSNITKRLSEKVKKPKDTTFSFGTGFMLYKCQNCNKTFAKEDSLCRHKAFCFGMDTLGIYPPKASTTRVNVKASRKSRKPTSTVISTKKPADRLEQENKDDVQTPESPVIKVEANEDKESSRNDNDVIMDSTDDQESVISNRANGSADNNGMDGFDDTNEFNSSGHFSEIYDSDDLFDSFMESPGKASNVEKGEVDKHPLQSNRWLTELSKNELEKIKQLINEEELQCLKCDRKYGNISNLHRHAFRHLGWKRFRCTLCEFTGYNRSECKTHLTRVHLENSDNNPNKFILDLEPEKMKAGVSKRSRVESKRQSSLRVLQKMQEVRRERQGQGFSPQKRSVNEPFNISTRNSPRAFDIRPYQRIEQGAVLFTRSGHYPKPVSSKKGDSDDESDSDNSLIEELSTTHSEADNVSETKTADLLVHEENGLEPPELSREIDIPTQEEVTFGEMDAQEAPNLTEALAEELTVIEEPVQEIQGNGEFASREVIYVYVDENGQVEQDISITGNDTAIVETATVVQGENNNVYVMNDELANVPVITTTESDLALSAINTGLVEISMDIDPQEVLITNELLVDQMVPETSADSVNVITDEEIEDPDIVDDSTNTPLEQGMSKGDQVVIREQGTVSKDDVSKDSETNSEVVNEDSEHDDIDKSDEDNAERKVTQESSPAEDRESSQP